jgi:hypothetical protein
MNAFPSACVMLLCAFQLAAADNTPKKATANESPLVVTTGYGVDGLVLWLAADSGVTRDTNNNITALADKTGNFPSPHPMQTRSRPMSPTV